MRSRRRDSLETVCLSELMVEVPALPTHKRLLDLQLGYESVIGCQAPGSLVLVTELGDWPPSSFAFL